MREPHWAAGGATNAKPAAATLADDPPSLQTALLVLIAAAGLYARSGLSPLQETIRLSLSLSDNQMALLQGPAPALLPALLAVPVGFLVDRHSRARILLASLLLQLLGAVLTALAPGFAVLVIARCLVGFAHTVICIAAFSLLADLFAPSRRGIGSTAIVVGQFGGMAAAYALGGALAARFAEHEAGWRSAMLWASAPLLVVTLLAVCLQEPKRGDAATEPPVAAASALAGLWRLRAALLPLLGGLCLIELSNSAALAWAAPVLARNFALAPDDVGATLSLVLLASGILGSLAGGLLGDRWQRTGGPRRTARGLALVALLAAPAGLFGITASLLPASLLLFLFLLGTGALIVAAVALLTIVTPASLRGVCLALMLVCNLLFGVALAPPVVSLLAGAANVGLGPALALVSVVAGIGSALGFVACARALRRTPA